VQWRVASVCRRRAPYRLLLTPSPPSLLSLLPPAPHRLPLPLPAVGGNTYGGFGTANTSVLARDYVPRGPVQLNGVAVDISCGYDYCAAVMADGTVQMWGRSNGVMSGLMVPASNANIGDNEAPWSIGRTFPASSGVTGVVCSYSYCAAMAPGCLRMWGYGNEVLGYGIGYADVGNDERVQDVPCLGGCTSTVPLTSFPLPVGGVGSPDVVAGSLHTCTVTQGAVK
jgi:hypothetical protein